MEGGGMKSVTILLPFMIDNLLIAQIERIPRFSLKGHFRIIKRILPAQACWGVKMIRA